MLNQWNFKDFFEAKVIDLTNKQPFQKEWLPKEKKHKKGTGKPWNYFVVLGGDSTLFYRWGHEGNIVPWPEVLKQADAIAKSGPYEFLGSQGIMITPDNSVIIKRSTDETRWPGSRNKYTKDLPLIVRELLDRKIIHPYSKIYVGNWAGQTGEYMGEADEIAKQGKDLPPHLILYHGTHNQRWWEIMSKGIVPQPEVHQRQWKQEKGGHRGNVVYLTSTPYQAVTYAKKAVNVARANGVSGATPIILKVIVRKKDYDKLQSDDDHIEKGGDPNDWYESLSFFGQVAYKGIIPPKDLDVYKSLEMKTIWDTIQGPELGGEIQPSNSLSAGSSPGAEDMAISK